MPRAVLTGGPGAGKTTLLSALAARGVEGQAGWVFFDRGPWEAVGMLHEAASLTQAELESYCSQFAVQHVFVLPPWEAIYAIDSELDQTYAESVAIYGRIVAWYG